MSRVSDADPQVWSRVRVALACGGLLLGLRGLTQDAAWVEATWLEGWGLRLASTLSWLSGAFPVSVAEVLLVVLLAAEGWYAMDGLAEVAARRRGVGNAAACAVGHLTELLAVGAVVFYASWGVAYARAPALARLGLADVVGRDAAADRAWFRSMAELSVDRANQAYRAIHRSDDAGEVTALPADLDVDAAIDRGFEAVGRQLRLGPSFTASRGPSKAPFAGDVMSWLGIGGIYIPFTGEATVNGGPPAWQRVATTAHEKAHQRMIAPEDEATFFGLLACAASPEPLLQYAAWEGISRQLVRAVAVTDREAATALQAAWLPGVRRDQAAAAEYWDAFQGPLERIAEWMNDHYLRANRVEHGVAAYGRAGRLLLAYAASADGQVDWAPLPASPAP